LSCLEELKRRLRVVRQCMRCGARITSKFQPKYCPFCGGPIAEKVIVLKNEAEGQGRRPGRRKVH